MKNGGHSNNGQSKSEFAAQQTQQEILIEKIRLLLERTDPEDWKHGGKPLDPYERFEKPRQTWEDVYCLDIPSGVLVVRASIPVRADFAGKGFVLLPIAPANHTVEIRAKGWHHSELTDPYKRSRLSDRRCTVLAEGDVAIQIFEFVAETFAKHHTAKQQAFDKEAYHFVTSLPKLLKEETSNKWDRLEDVPGDVHYVATLNGIQIDVSRSIIEQREQYGLTLSKGNMESKVQDVGLIKEIYEGVQQLGQTSRLLSLSKALESI